MFLSVGIRDQKEQKDSNIILHLFSDGFQKQSQHIIMKSWVH